MADQTGPSSVAAKPAKRSAKAFIIHEVTGLLAAALYLSVPMCLFSLHRAITLKQMGIDFHFTGWAFINALVLAKAIPVAEDLGLGSRYRSRPLIWPILAKSILFAILLIVVHDVEEGLKGLFSGKGFIDSIPPLGGGGPLGLLLMGANAAIALIPWFAYQELSIAMGPGNLRALLFKPRAQQ
jgi:hypothetical protein